MEIEKYEVIVIGAGPAGLCAAIQTSSNGMKTAIFDENAKPGGQLFKQIHKFFGSKEQKAGVRGFEIGEELLEKAKDNGVEVFLNSQVLGIYDNKEITVMEEDGVHHCKGDFIVIATGARENMLPFKGWTLPGVIGAGAAQTIANLYGYVPGKKVLMVGTGNVGLVVSYQLIQAGCDVVGLVDVCDHIGGYGVHAAKISRMGVPILLRHTVIEAKGKESVESAVIAEVDDHFQPIKGTEKEIEVDTICLAVGLSPMNQLTKMIGCKMKDKGGFVPELDEYGQTSVKGIYSAGDSTGIEEASSAMIEGKIVGISISYEAGYITKEQFDEQKNKETNSLDSLHQGMFAPKNRGKVLEKTDEGIPLSKNLLTKGYLLDDEITNYPGVTVKKGIHPVIECTQNIPCNPCQDACKFGCISVNGNITNLPKLNEDAKCTACGMCVATCAGQAIFLVNEDYDDEHASITIPYELFPIPAEGSKGMALSRDGKEVCSATVQSVRTAKNMDRTMLLTMLVPKEYAMKARFFKKEESV